MSSDERPERPGDRNVVSMRDWRERTSSAKPRPPRKAPRLEAWHLWLLLAALAAAATLLGG